MQTRAITFRISQFPVSLSRIAPTISILLLLCFARQGVTQTLTWATPERDTTTQIGGEYGEQGVGAANFNGALWVAYNGTTSVDPAGDAYVYVASNTNGGIYYSNKTQVTVSNGAQIVASANNPALGIFNGQLYLAYIDAYGVANFVSSTDGEHWGENVQTSCSSGGSIIYDASPTLAAFNGYLWMGLRDHNNHYLVLCRIASNGTAVASEYGTIQLNFNPSLAVYNGLLYIAAESYNSNHHIDIYTSPDGATLTHSNAAASQETSTAPSLLVHSNILYLGFRSNPGKEFLYMYSTDGVTFSGNINPHWTESGPPVLVSADNLPGSPYNGQVYVYFGSDTSGPWYLCSNHGH